ncbi:hypothetical protein KC901_01395 [Patescibacteria group bacterium]|nr:hypothetical protein [Patescibacteria group bacterium]
MERTPRTILIRTIGVLFFIGISIFGYNRFGRYLQGPRIVDISLERYQTIETLSVLVEGSTNNTESMTINERTIPMNDDSTFSEVVVLSPGTNIMEIVVTDSFGKQKEYRYTLYSTKTNSPYKNNYTEAQQAQEEQENAESLPS